MPPSEQPRFTVTFQATDRDSVPAVVRLRALLKAAWRSYGLRCIEAKESPATTKTARPRKGTNRA